MVRQVSSGPFSITTAPMLTTCTRCNKAVLAATVRGLDVHVDYACLNDAGELAALLEGRKTYTLVAQDYLAIRTRYNIAAGPPERPVLADHACRPVPPHHIEIKWSQAAQGLLTVLLPGAVPIDSDVDAPPPF